MTTEEEVIRRKLVTDERILRRLARRLVSLEPLQGAAIPEETIRPDIEILRGTLEKQEKALAVHHEEEEYYSRRQQHIEQEIADLQVEICNLKESLDQEQERRRNKDAYDTIAKEILAFPSRKELHSLLEQMEQEIELVNSAQHEIQECMERDAIAGYEAIQMLKLAKRQVEMDLKATKTIF